MHIGFVEPLSRAWDRARRMLFQPFDLVKWLVLGFSAWLAGLASGSGGGGANVKDGEWDGPKQAVRSLGDAWESLIDNLVWLPLILLLLCVVVALILVLLWISSRAKFIFLDNVVHERAQIVEPWTRLRRLGNSLFLWRAGFAVALFTALLLVAVAVFAPAATLSVNEALHGLSFAAMFFGLIAVVGLSLVAAFVLLFLENFVIPIMYRYDLTATAAWKAFLPWLRSHAGWFIVYVLFVVLLAVPLTLAYLLLCCCTCCIVAIPYVGTVVLLPIWVTYRAFGPEFLAQFDPGLDIFWKADTTPELEAESAPPLEAE